jgi:hypothetical protein
VAAGRVSRRLGLCFRCRLNQRGGAGSPASIRRGFKPWDEVVDIMDGRREGQIILPPRGPPLM